MNSFFSIRFISISFFLSAALLFGQTQSATAESVNASVISILSSSASNGACSQWQKQDSVTCVFAGQDANLYLRQCENICYISRRGPDNWSPNCDLESVCYPKDPTSFNGACSPWEPISGSTCYDPETQSWAQAWQRACTVGLSEQWCSPNYPPSK